MKLLAILILLIGFVKANWILSLVDRSRWRNQSNVCDSAPSLNARLLCLRSPEIVRLMETGLSEAVAECQKQFAYDQWDCAARLGLEDEYLKLKGKENALFYSLLSASSSRAVSRACAEGKLSDCFCGPLPSKSEASFVWSGCSDNVSYGNRITRQILDSAEDKRSADSLMNIHNNGVGRRLLAKQMERKCKCHGVSGSCITRTCYKAVPSVTSLVSILRAKYIKASLVQLSLNASTLTLVNRTPLTGRHQRSSTTQLNAQKPAPNELVFIDESPDACNLNQANGVPWSVGRECMSKEGCDQMCCNRGFIRIREVYQEYCNCKFVYCCRVECDVCPNEITRFYCK